MYLLIVTVVLFSIFSTTVLMYVSMATPIGPWIAPTLVLLGMSVFRVFSFFNFKSDRVSKNLFYSVVGGSPGGILATALGFTFPTLYFLDKNLFNSWLDRPVFFCFVITSMTFLCGLIAFVFVNKVEQNLIYEQKLAFPIGELTYKMISSGNSKTQSSRLNLGIIVTLVFCVLQDGLLKVKGIIPKCFKIFSGTVYKYFYIPSINFDLFPLFWAIGFVTGHVIAIPLLAGTLSKWFFADIINKIFFQNLSNMEFMLAFCSGLVLFSAVAGFKNFIFSFIVSNKAFSRIKFNLLISKLTRNLKLEIKFVYFLLLILTSAFLFYFEFSLIAQCYLILFSLISTYQVVIIAGKIGLAQLGRFATLVMIPAMLIFKLNYVQIVIVATFVELVSGIATDLLFGRKIGYLAGVNISRIKILQIIGVFVSAFTAGFVFFFFSKHLQLGSELLFAQRAQARALLVNFKNFNYGVLFVGFIFGVFLKKLRLNPMLVLSGLLMPINITVGLLTGALIRYLTPKRYDFEPFWSGVFATQSIWMLLKAI
jgi:uncharacterized oligopeptide transporter (OPT) family protein